MKLRAARADDASAIGAYQHRCWIEGYAHLVAPEVLDRLRVDERIARWEKLLAEGPPASTVVAVVDDVPVGHVRVEDDVLANLYVDPRHWRRGIGRVLLETGEELLRGGGHRGGLLWTFVGNDRAISLYTAAGWEPDGTIEVHDTSAGVPMAEQRMVKDLDPAVR